MLVATVFSTNKLAALLQQTLTRSCSLPTPTETMPDGLSLSVFYVQLVGTYTDISMWRAVFISLDLSVFLFFGGLDQPVT
jgi:hypothetical protein